MTTSFQFRDPLNRNPYVADQKSPVIYPYARWGDFATNPYLYVYGRPLDFRSYYGEDLNLSARPITRTIQPRVLQYAAPEAVTVAPKLVDTGVALNNRFAALGAQVDDARRRNQLLALMLVLLAAAGIAALVMRRQ